MEKSKKIFKNLLVFILLIGLTFYIFLKDQDIMQIVKVLSNVDIKFIIIAIICMFIYVICEAINIGRTLKILGESTNFFKNIKYALIGFFFSSITPAATGGQPMEIYYMYKDKISVANSTLALLINLCAFQIITISFALVSIFINIQYLSKGLIWFFILGITLNASALVLLLIGIFSKRLSTALIKFAVKILKFFRIKNIQQKQEKLETEIGKYQGSAAYIKKNKNIIVKTLITTFIQVIFFYSVSYWVYRSFGFNEHNIFDIVTLQAVLYATVSGIPSPGAVGITEGGFMSIFRSVYAQEAIGGAMLLSRGISFYFLVLISGIVSIISSLKIKKVDKE